MKAGLLAISAVFALSGVSAINLRSEADKITVQNQCCKALKAKCLACGAQMSWQEFCSKLPKSAEGESRKTKYNLKVECEQLAEKVTNSGSNTDGVIADQVMEHGFDHDNTIRG